MTALTCEPPHLIDVDTAAALLNVSRSTTYDLIRSGQLRSLKIGRRRLIPRAAIDEAISALTVEGF